MNARNNISLFNLCRSFRNKWLGNRRFLCQKIGKSHQKSASSNDCCINTDLSILGQPSAESHPHLLAYGEVIPGIQLTEIHERRVKIFASLSAFTRSNTIKNHVLLLPSAPRVFMYDKIPYPYRQNSDFLYLTGCQEPDTVFVIHGERNSTKPRVVAFVPNVDLLAAQWEGRRTDPEAAMKHYGVDAAYTIGELEAYCATLLKPIDGSMLWYDFTDSKLQSDCVTNILVKLLDQKVPMENPRPLIHRQRLLKSPAEVSLMRSSAKIASEAMKEVMRASHPYCTEHQLAAVFEYQCKLRGAERLAYPSVVAGGQRANIIHYSASNQVIRGDEMILMDAGCELHGYASDLTRTWPVSGEFTPVQQALYERLLSVQMDLLGALRNISSLDALFSQMCEKIGFLLQDLGALPRGLSTTELARFGYKYCPHHVSHYLGMDVHDTHSVPRTGNLEPNMIVTVEPGVYIPADDVTVPRRFRGLGLRIEDDVLITQSGIEVLTEDCPRGVDELKRIVQSRS